MTSAYAAQGPKLNIKTATCTQCSKKVHTYEKADFEGKTFHADCLLKYMQSSGTFDKVKEADKNFAKVDGSKKKMESPIAIPEPASSGFYCSNTNCGQNFKVGATKCHICKSPSYQEVFEGKKP